MREGIVHEESAGPRSPLLEHRVFIVDDDDDVRLLLRVVLEREGYRVVGEASDGVEALERIAVAAPSVLIVDMNMPRLGGLDLIRRVRAGSTPVIIGYTAAAATDERRELLTLGVPVVSKQDGTGSLVRVLETLTDGRAVPLPD